LAHRIQVKAIDELALLVRAFNEMTQELNANSQELERRRRFTEAILESIPTGVISLDFDGTIRRVNRALRQIFSDEQVTRARRLSDLFTAEDTAEIEYMMKRARRTGVVSRQFEHHRNDRLLQLSVTVSALEAKPASGFVLVVEDTTDLLHAQKATAWREVARRIAHEIKNPLTPIALSSERIARQLDRAGNQDDVARILRECSKTIGREVESLKTLVDEFSQFARFPAAQMAPSDLNEIVRAGLAVFDGRLGGIQVIEELAADLPPVFVDREQFKMVVVNLVDNAAEAMQRSLVKRLYVGTHLASPEVVELIVADTGHGVSPEDREKLFLPYFSTKNRGTGLGLAIVNHIVVEHKAQIRVEDNVPSGARFVVEMAPMTVPEAGRKPAEARV
jgi:PAS domain S-box-containing protein